MWNLLRSLRKQRLTLEQLEMIQGIARQVVLTLEYTRPLPGAEKKALALKTVQSLLRSIGILAPESLVDVAIEASVAVLKALQGSTYLQNPFDGVSSTPGAKGARAQEGGGVPNGSFQP